MTRKKEQVELRYYEIPAGELLLALTGKNWIRSYGFDKNDQPIKSQHFHNLLEIGYCFKGRGKMVMEEKTYPYNDGTITIIPKNFPHITNGECRQQHHWEYLFIDVERALSQLFPGNKRQNEAFLECMSRRVQCIPGGQQPQLEFLIRSILLEMEQRRPFYGEAVSGLVRALFVEILRWDQEQNSQEQQKQGMGVNQETARQQPEQVQVSAALEYVEKNFAREIKISQLAEACHMSETHFRRLFGQSMGMAPLAYINQVRIRRACQMLQKNEETIAEISARCGFSSLATFNRNFHRVTGITPKEWKHHPEAFERRLKEKIIAVREGW